MKALRPVITSNGVPHFQMTRSIREEKGRKGWGGFKDGDDLLEIQFLFV